MTKPGLLIFNSGSSSIKFAFFEIGSQLKRVIDGKIECVGNALGRFFVKGLNPSDNFSHTVALKDYKEAVVFVLDWLERKISPNLIIAVGHRIMHAGTNYYEAQKISAEIIKELKLGQEVYLVKTSY